MRSRFPDAGFLIALVAIIGAIGCAEGLRAQDLRSWTVDQDRSTLWVETGRSGLLFFLGHDHAILPREWSAELCMARPVDQGAHGTVTIRTESLVIDTDSARAVAGLGGGPGEEDRREIQQKMLDSANLAAERYPEIRLELRATGPEEDGSVPVAGTLTVRGVSVDIAMPVEVREEGDRISLSGSVHANQTDFGIEPESVAGVVNVADEVELHFELVASATSERCDVAEMWSLN